MLKRKFIVALNTRINSYTKRQLLCKENHPIAPNSVELSAQNGHTTINHWFDRTNKISINRVLFYYVYPQMCTQADTTCIDAIFLLVFLVLIAVISKSCVMDEDHGSDIYFMNAVLLKSNILKEAKNESQNSIRYKLFRSLGINILSNAVFVYGIWLSFYLCRHPIHTIHDQWSINQCTASPTYATLIYACLLLVLCCTRTYFNVDIVSHSFRSIIPSIYTMTFFLWLIYLLNVQLLWLT